MWFRLPRGRAYRGFTRMIADQGTIARSQHCQTSARSENRNTKDEALYKEQAVSKEEILEAIKKMAEELGRAPSLPELRDKNGISPRQVRRNFLSYTGALKACGLERGGAGYTTPMDALFKDWAELTRKLGRVPK